MINYSESFHSDIDSGTDSEVDSVESDGVIAPTNVLPLETQNLYAANAYYEEKIKLIEAETQRDTEEINAQIRASDETIARAEGAIAAFDRRASDRRASTSLLFIITGIGSNLIALGSVGLLSINSQLALSLGITGLWYPVSCLILGSSLLIIGVRILRNSNKDTQNQPVAEPMRHPSLYQARSTYLYRLFHSDVATNSRSNVGSNRLFKYSMPNFDK